MIPNVGSVDRIARFVVGAALLVAPLLPATAGLFLSMGNWKYAVSAVGLVMLATAVMRFCPAYTLLGMNTCPIAKS